MKKKISKIICITLTFILILSVFSGCGPGEGEQVPIPKIVPEEQIMADKYERNDDITDLVTYSFDYITNKKGSGDRMDVVPMFDHFKVQVDAWESMTVGLSTMDQIIKIIDRANEAYVKEKTNAIIAERQAKIDKEYEEAKAQAAAKGKTYDKPKKEVRTDDIKFDNPYTYAITYSTEADAKRHEYQPTLLIDSGRNSKLYLYVSKYNIPYVTLTFASVGKVYNNKILQQSDWVMNRIVAGKVTSYKADQNGKLPAFVDVDGRNKAAKQNIVISGGISFGGDGFTWESLMTLCKALNLKEGSDRNGFVQSSDSKFTYYTIRLNTNSINCDAPYNTEKMVYSPVTRLVATFDPLSQVCINWTIDTNSSIDTYENKKHEFSTPIHVNIHEYKVDTNDYAGMKETINKWIADNSINTTTEYCAIDLSTGEYFGKVDTGMTNIELEPVINGVAYQCLSSEPGDNGAIIGKYINSAEYAKAEAMGNEAEAQAHIEAHTKELEIYCGVKDSDGTILGRFDGSSKLMQAEKTYFVVDYKTGVNGYENVKVLSEENVGQLLLLYAKTYMLTEDQSDTIYEICYTDGLLALRDYMDETFNSGSEDNSTKNYLDIAKSAKKNTDADIGTFKFEDQSVQFVNLTTTGLTSLGFNPDGDVQISVDDEVSIIDFYCKGDIDVEVLHSANTNSIPAMNIDSDQFEFYSGIKVGMTQDDLLNIFGNEYDAINDEHFILKNNTVTLIASYGLDDTTIHTIYLINNALC